MRERYLVFGFGISGQAVCKVLLARNKTIDVIDQSDNIQSDLLDRILESNGSIFSPDRLLEADFNFAVYEEIVVSPGFDWEHPVLRLARDKGSKIVGELEWGINQLAGRKVLVTGSNGKSTVVSLIHHLLIKLNFQSELIGNIGRAVSDLVEVNSVKDTKSTESQRILVIEASSYQLQASQEFIPEVAIITNLVENHLERHGNLSSYLEAKLKPFKRMTPNGVAIMPIELALAIIPLGEGVKLGLVSGSVNQDFALDLGSFELQAQVDFSPVKSNDQILIFNKQELTLSLNLKSISLIGLHNRVNIAYALLALYGLGIKFTNQQILAALESFVPPKYRLEIIKSSIKEAVWINDSKSTTPESTRIGFRAVAEHYPDRLVTLMLGGVMKRASFNGLWKELADSKSRLNEIVFFGADADKLALDYLGSSESLIPYKVITDLSLAVSYIKTTSLQLVLFSPGCLSFDSFGSFEERGAFFSDLAR